MTFDMGMWKKRAVEEFDTIANEEWQRTIWFGGGDGKWIDSPDERINSFYDLLISELLSQSDHGLGHDQVSEVSKLIGMMDELCDNTPDSIKPADLIDDPRWKEIRRQAAIARDVLSRPA